MVLCSHSGKAQPYSLIDTPLRQLTLETSYGFASTTLPSFDYPITVTLHIEGMFGIKRYLLSEHSNQIVDYAHPHAFVGYYTMLNAPVESETRVRTVTMNLLRMGIGIRDGIGYRLEQAAITPTINSAMLLARPSFARLPQDCDSASQAERLNNGLHFGTLTAAGVDFQIASALAVNLNYDWMIVFPRFVPLQFMGSHFLQWGLQIVAGYMIDAVFGKFPMLLPWAHFFIKNAINFTLYALRRNQMHFPLASEAPLSVQSFKVGVSFYIGPKVLD